METPVQSVLLTPRFIRALRDAAHILDAEANELAGFSASDMQTTMLRAGAKPELIRVPHRLSLAVSNEIQRLRDISDTLEEAIPKKAEEEDE